MNDPVEITRKLEFDAGHRIPNHKSKCRNVHGHRYVIEATITGVIQAPAGESDDGMIIDFGDLKLAMNEAVVEPWDHACLVWSRDSQMIEAISCLDAGHKTIVLEVVPTVENLVIVAADAIKSRLNDLSPAFKLVRVRLYETPNCWADWLAT